ncbi:CST complex subunit STN1 [Blyttiomyces sp. JEL0837]|nr:CST complex subunit STN1 [Blyttiomyces sp. JEL0837]
MATTSTSASTNPINNNNNNNNNKEQRLHQQQRHQHQQQDPDDDDDNNIIAPNPLPPYLFGLDFTFWVSVRLMIKDILDLTPHPDVPDVYIYQNYNRPIRKVEICGVITAKHERDSNVNYYVDDGSSTIPCVYWFPEELRMKHDRKTFKLGDLVNVTGRVSEYRFQRQVIVNSIVVESDPNSELLHWLEVIDLKQTAYNVNMVLPKDHLDRIREMADNINQRGGSNSDWANNDGEDHFNESESGLERKIEKLESTIANAMNPTTKVTNETFTEIVKLYIETMTHPANKPTNPTFQFKTIRSNTILESVAISILKKLLSYKSNAATTTTNIGTNQITKLYQISFRNLVEQGFMYHQDVERDMFTVLRYDVNLGSGLVEVLSGRVRQGQGQGQRRGGKALRIGEPDGSGGDATGLPLDFIAVLFRERAQFRHVSMATIKTCMKRLVKESIVIEDGPSRYKLCS